MTPQPGFTIMSDCGNMSDLNDMDVPKMLAGAWSVCSPDDFPLRDQLNNCEKTFLIDFAKYIEDLMASPIAAAEPATVLGDILMTARHRYSQLSKDTSLSPGHVAILTLLHLLKNLFASDNMKYQTLQSFLAVYPAFEKRSIAEQEKLFHSANWMHILFKITTAKKNKGLVMIVIPKLVEGNGVQYVTGSGQTIPTQDRVKIYETEGDVVPIKRLQRKTKKELMEQTGESGRKSGGKSKKTTKKKATYVKKTSLRDGSYRGIAQKTVVVRGKSARSKRTVQETYSSTIDDSDNFSDGIISNDNGQDYVGYIDIDDDMETELRTQNLKNCYQPLPPPMLNLAPPVPVCRSQSSFSQAAAFISSNQSGSAVAPASYVKSPKECYVTIEANGIRKISSANWSSMFNSSRPADDQLDMFRETSEDSDLSGESGQCFPPHLFHQTSGTFEGVNFPTSNGHSLGSPNPQPRTLERIHSASLESNLGEVDIELLEKELVDGVPSTGADPLWLNRSTSASSLSGLQVN